MVSAEGGGINFIANQGDFESVRTEKTHLLWSVNKRSWIVLLLCYACVILLWCCFCGTWMSPVVVKILTVKAEADTDFHLRVLSME